MLGVCQRQSGRARASQRFVDREEWRRPMDVVKADLGRCGGHGKCYLIAPDLFEPFDDEAIRPSWVSRSIPTTRNA
jgi:hypothetical protein